MDASGGEDGRGYTGGDNVLRAVAPSAACGCVGGEASDGDESEARATARYEQLLWCGWWCGELRTEAAEGGITAESLVGLTTAAQLLLLLMLLTVPVKDNDMPAPPLTAGISRRCRAAATSGETPAEAAHTAGVLDHPGGGRGAAGRCDGRALVNATALAVAPLRANAAARCCSCSSSSCASAVGAV